MHLVNLSTPPPKKNTESNESSCTVDFEAALIRQHQRAEVAAAMQARNTHDPSFNRCMTAAFAVSDLLLVTVMGFFFISLAGCTN